MLRLHVISRPIRSCGVPLHLSEDQRSQFNKQIEDSTFHPFTCAQKQKKIIPYDKN